MIRMIETLLKLIKEIDETGTQLNNVKAELRQKDFDLKVKKTAMEFSEEYDEFREGLKVKEIAPKILDATIQECEEIITLKQKRDELEHKLTVLKLQFQYTKEVIDSQK